MYIDPSFPVRSLVPDPSRLKVQCLLDRPWLVGVPFWRVCILERRARQDVILTCLVIVNGVFFRIVFPDPERVPICEDFGILLDGVPVGLCDGILVADAQSLRAGNSFKPTSNKEDLAVFPTLVLGTGNGKEVWKKKYRCSPEFVVDLQSQRSLVLSRHFQTCGKRHCVLDRLGAAIA